MARSVRVLEFWPAPSEFNFDCRKVISELYAAVATGSLEYCAARLLSLLIWSCSCEPNGTSTALGVTKVMYANGCVVSSGFGFR